MRVKPWSDSHFGVFLALALHTALHLLSSPSLAGGRHDPASAWATHCTGRFFAIGPYALMTAVTRPTPGAQMDFSLFPP
jgi:hypothetical protein